MLEALGSTRSRDTGKRSMQDAQSCHFEKQGIRTPEWNTGRLRVAAVGESVDALTEPASGVVLSLGDNSCWKQ